MDTADDNATNKSNCPSISQANSMNAFTQTSSHATTYHHLPQHTLASDAMDAIWHAHTYDYHYYTI